MEAKTTLTALECIEKIHQNSLNSELKHENFENLREELNTLNLYLKAEDVETVLFANAVVIHYTKSTFSEVFSHLGLGEFHILKYRNFLKNMYDKKLILNTDRWKQKFDEYTISDEILTAITENRPLDLPDEISEKREPNLIDILEEFDFFGSLYDNNKISRWDFKGKIKKLPLVYPHRPIFKYISSLQLDIFEVFFFLDTIWDAARRGDNDFNTDVQTTVDDFFQEKGIASEYFRAVVEGKTKLTRKNLIELSKQQYINKTRAKLSDKMIKFLRENEKLVIDNFTDSNKKLMQFKNFPERKLIYNEEVSGQIAVLEEIMTEKKFKVVRKRLNSKNMPVGITALLHGSPGTGKTETVYQLAKRTGRNIFKVDLSETKSMWFGESQKITKKIFSNYRELCKMEKKIPILLFNEADGIIGKRKPTEISSVADTENAIQNIFLEELENFEGILIATTNLIDNIDAAFERRFLYKINFEKPNAEVSAKIWMLKFPYLTEDQALELAIKYNFSAGEMENIARKCSTHEILDGGNSDFELVMKFCSEEKWTGNEVRRIGF